MAGDFTDLRIWREAKDLAVLVYHLTEAFPKTEAYALTSQLRRAAVSVAANIAEASGRYHWKDRIQLLRVARGSITETRSHLCIAHEVRYLPSEALQDIDNRYKRLTLQINNFVKAQKSTAPIN